MITRIEIDGYKSFERFELDLFPFTVIAGSNAVGKSNLFDVFRHISKLVTKTLREAFETERGSLLDLFTIYPDGSHKPTIRYAIEMLLPASVQDEFSVEATLKYLRLRYELAVTYNEDGHLTLLHESLKPIKREDDNFLKIYPNVKKALPKITGGRKPFIDTPHDEQSIVISQDGNAGNKRKSNLSGAQRTVLSSVTTVEFPHAYAAKRLLEDIHFLQLNPEKLRQPSKLAEPPYLTADGDHLAAMLARLKKQEETVLQMISNDLAAVVPSVDKVLIEEDTSREVVVVSIKHVDGYQVPSVLLSDGTLRILALIAIDYDPEFNGTIILEEPENGVYPGRINEIVDLLRSMAHVDDPSTAMRQVIANTHSTQVMSATQENELIFASLRKVVREKKRYFVTDMASVRASVNEGLFTRASQVARQEAERIMKNRAESEEVLKGAL